MKILEKQPGKDFVVLNLSDPQLSDTEYDESHPRMQILLRTVGELVEKEHPDLITVSGDLSYGSHYSGYRKFAAMMEKTGIPWAPVWGNHDNQAGKGVVNIQGMILNQTSPLCLYEKGDYPEEDGQGNYTVGITENGKPLTALLMVDSHDRDPYNGGLDWARLRPGQLERIGEECRRLSSLGYKDAVMVLHIPFYAYRDAFREAFSAICKPEEVNPAESGEAKYWNEGYKDSFGVCHEEICSYPEEDGAFDMLLRTGLVKAVIAGHDHTDNFSINYKGIRLVYSMKAGRGCYWDKNINGGTVLRIGSDGIREITHRYVDVSDLLTSDNI